VLGFVFAWAVCVFSARVGAAEAVVEYAWKPMTIGGGGWVTGLAISPAEKGLVYARTDVAGAYRWDAASGAWKAIVTAASLPAGVLSYGNHGGVDSLVGAPGDARVAYLAFAATPYGGGAGQIYRSSNRGDTWVATNFIRHRVKMEPNGEGRQEGERLAVDPANADIVYFGSIDDGLWRTRDGGANWARVEAIPAGTPGHGVNTVVFDPATRGRGDDAGTRVIHVTVDGGGVFRSDDAGRTWARISDNGPGAGKPRDAAAGSDGVYYVAHDSAEGEGGAAGGFGSVWKFSADAGWTDITPPPPDGGKRAWWAVAVDPADPRHVVAMRSGGRFFVSRDQGATWSSHGFRLKSPQIHWQEAQTNHWLSVGEIAFDPFASGRLWFAEGFGVWQADDFEARDIVWSSVSAGIEETCGNDVIAPPGGRPVAAMWDLGVMRFDDVDAYTARKSPAGFMSAWSLDWCAAEPAFLAGVLRSQHGFVPHVDCSGYSTDGGRTWTRFAALENNTLPAELKFGVIAVSARDTDNLVWVPSGRKSPHFTRDRGATWTPSRLEGAEVTGLNEHYTAAKPLCADRVAPATFYLHVPDVGVFRSTDGGAHFSKRGNPIPKGGTKAVLKATPGHAGHLWLADGVNGPLWHSADGGATWRVTPGLGHVFSVGFGKARDREGYPTLFVAGRKDGRAGLFRSEDRGATWARIGEFPLGIADWIDALDGDKDVFGKVYVAFAGSGFVYGAEAAGR
jgi:photosystem II stability/assembly factor-like uncharacterized protein